MTDAEKGARVAELIKKQQSGKITPAELDELKKLLAGATKDPLSSIPVPTKADYDAAVKKAAADATARGDTIPAADKGKGMARPTGPAPEGQQWVQGPTGWVLAPIAKPEDMKVNPDLPALPGTAKTPSGDIVPLPPPGQTGQENPALYTPPAKEEPKWDANGWALVDGKWVAGPNAKYGPEKKAEPAPSTPAPAPDARGYGDRTREFEEAEASRGEPSPTIPAIPSEELPKATDSKKKFGDILKDLAGKYGVPILEIIQAVGYQRGGINKPTLLDQKYQEKLDQQEKEWAKKLEDEKTARDEATYQRRITEQRAWEAQQAELNRIADKAARGEELTAREKIAKMQLDASRAARGTAGTASIIPE
jgi:hypothetical protein